MFIQSYLVYNKAQKHIEKCLYIVHGMFFWNILAGRYNVF